MAEETRIVKIEIDQEDSFAKLATLKAAIVDNKNQQAELRKAYKDGQITLKEFSDEIVRNEANAKKQTAQYNELQKTVTGVKSPFDKLSESINGLGQKMGAATPALDKITGGALSAAEGVAKMTQSAYAFMATGWGAIIAALGLALGALITYLKGSGDGADKLAFVMAGLKGAFNVLKDLVIGVGRSLSTLFTDPKQALIDFGNFLASQITNRIVGMMELIPKLGEALNLVFHGQFSEAGKVAVDAVGKVALGIEDASTKLSDFIENVKKETQATYDMAKAIDALEDRERNYKLTASATTLEIQRLTLAAKNRSLTAEEQIKILDKAAELEKQKANELTAIRTAQLQQTLNEAALRLNLDQKKGESLDAYAARLINFSGTQGELIDEEKDKIIAALEAVNQARGESLNLLEKLKNKEDAAYLKAEQEKLKIQQDSDKKQSELQKLRLANTQAEWQDKVDKAKAANDAIDQKAQEEFNREKLLAQAKKDLNNDVYNTIAGTLKTFAGKSKATQIGLAIADAGLALTRIFSAPAAPFIEPFATATRIASAVTVAVKTGAAINQIQNAAAGGGSFLTHGPTTLTVGDNPGGVERVDVTPISGRGKTTINPFSGMIALAGGGTVITDGGYGKNTATFDTDQNIMIANVLSNLPSPVVSWKEFTELDTRVKTKQTITSR